MRQPDTLKLLSFDFFIYSSSETKPRLSKMQIFPGIFWNLWNFGMLHIYKTSIQSFQFICIYISDACNPISRLATLSRLFSSIDMVGFESLSQMNELASI